MSIAITRQWRATGDLARERREWAAAALAYEQHLQLAPDDAAIWIQLGHALKENGRLTEAMQAYERSRELNPRDDDRDLHLLELQKRIAHQNGATALPPREIPAGAALRPRNSPCWSEHIGLAAELRVAALIMERLQR